MTTPGATRPTLTIVSAVYNVSAYLEEFIASIEAQTYTLDSVQIVMVDDGSTDGSSEILRRQISKNLLDGDRELAEACMQAA